MRIIGATMGAAAAMFILMNAHPAAAATSVQSDPPVVLVSADVQVPTDDQVAELADRSMRIFMTALREKSMQGLWNHISFRFRQTFSVAQLDEVFKDFYDLKITGDPLAGKSPIFATSPVTNDDGNLVVDGYYTTSPWRIGFHLVFTMEGRTWKLVGINASAKPPASASSPQSTASQGP